MSRAERLLQLMQILRRHRYPVKGIVLATELDISLRTLYRDIATLQAQGACIEGEAGVGYLLRPGFTLPPLMFSIEEIEALVLGARWVNDRADAQLVLAAQNALAKITAVLPPNLQHELETTTLLIGPSEQIAVDDHILTDIRLAIRGERKIHIDYHDLKNKKSMRVIWPFALGFFDQVCMVVAWCELRQGFRHFRVDRIRCLNALEVQYPRRRQNLWKEWCKQEGITA